MESNQEIVKQKPEIDRSKEIQSVFTDMVQINVSNESVSLEMGIINPHTGKAVISHNIIMTIPHFVRFANVCHKSKEQIDKLILKAQKDIKK
jgi:hypothetical protein